jgi:hypothetical protein
MILTRLWILVVGLIAAAAVAFALMLIRPLSLQIVAERAGQLERTGQSAQLLLRADGRLRLDEVMQAAEDAVLREAVVTSAMSGGEPAMVRRTATDRLRVLSGALHAPLAMAEDGRGQLVGLISPEGGPVADSAQTLAALQRGLAGERVDQLALVGERVWRLSVAPLQSGDRHVGALLLGHELDGALAGALKEALGVEVAVLTRQRVTASTIALGESELLNRLPALLGGSSSSASSLPRVDSLPSSGVEQLVQLLPLTGTTTSPEAALALLTPRPTVVAPLALAERLIQTRAVDLPASFWQLLGLALSVGILLGWLIVRFEGVRPLRRLEQALRLSEEAGIEAIAPEALPRSVRPVAQAIRDSFASLWSRTRREGSGPVVTLGIDDPTASQPHPSPPGPQSSNETAASDLPETEARRLDPSAPAAALPPRDTERTEVAEPSDETSAVPRLVDAARTAQEPLGSRGRAEGAQSHPSAALSGEEVRDEERTAGPLAAAAPPWGEPAPMIDPPPPSPRPMRITASGIVVTMGALESAESETGSDTPAAQQDSAPSVRPPTPASNQQALAQALRTPVDGSRPLPGAPRPRSPGAAQPLGVMLERVYQDFISTKSQLGEPVEGITLEKFQNKLLTNRQQLMELYTCRDVRFQVYVKDGKAALKATPIL